MLAPLLDFRNATQFYLQTVELAHAYAPEWANYWVTPIPGEQETSQDPGLVLLHLFSHLAAYTANIENQIPVQRELAFFQFMGMALRPPLAANVALQFFLQADQAPQLVPAQSAVLPSDAQDIRFQTSQDLLVLPATLSAALSIIPAQDAWIDALPALQSGSNSAGVPIFVASQCTDQAELPLSHWFMLGDTSLFKPDSSLQSISLNFTGKQLFPEYFGQWFAGDLTPLGAALQANTDYTELAISLSSAPQAGPLTIAQLQQELYLQDAPGLAFDPASQTSSESEEEYWLLVKPAPQVKVLSALEEQLPVITGLQCTFIGKQIQPQAAAYNLVLLDISNSVYPFGETPKTNDAFYLSSNDVFNKTGAMVTLFFQLVAVKREFPVRLDWQFWDGKQWQSFNQTASDVSAWQFVDTTSNLQHDNPDGPTYIQFQCPPMQETTVAGTQGLWIRAVIAEGGYGQQGGFESTSVSATLANVPSSILSEAQKQSLTAYLNNVAGVNFSYTFTQSDFYPPFINQLQVTYSYSSSPSSYWSYNALELSRFLFSPFKPVAELASAFCFAFAAASFAPASLGQKLVLFFDLPQESNKADEHLLWEYHDGQAWRSLAVDDGSYGLTRSGLVSFIVPAEMQASYLFSQTAYWFRIVNPHVHRTIRVRGIYPNCVAAQNLTSVENEVLGSSNAQQFQTFNLNYTPVLPGLCLQVIENAGLDLAEQAMQQVTAESAGSVRAGDKTQAITLAKQALKLATDQLAHEWQMVENFTFSGPTDRVYTLDYQNGLITFGDGYHGMIPPAGHNNIIATYYEYTQGLAGNLGANSINLLRPGITNISAVNNPAPASGGVNGDQREQLLQNSPPLVKSSGWAVQLSDFGPLATQASPEVARANAVQQADRSIAVALLVQSADPRPYTNPALLASVQDSLRSVCLASLAPRVFTCAPHYVALNITVQLLVEIAADQLQALQQDLLASLQAWCQPVFGGNQGQGWQFGQTVQASALGVFLRQLPHVKLVMGLNLNGVQNGDVLLQALELPIAGDLQIYLTREA